jgi:Cd2+/Zn2+-exporting ATPase
MSGSTASAAALSPSSSAAKRTSAARLEFWKTNYELLLAIIALIALLIGWLGGSVFGVLPPWAVVVAAVTSFAAGGYVGVRETLLGLRHGKFDIDFLMTAAAFGAAAIGEWEEGALLLFLFTLAGALETFAMDRTRNAIAALSDLRPPVARVLRGEEEVEMVVEELVPGDLVVVRPGERLPMDGAVVKGRSTIDQSPITGESVPVHKESGDPVFAGTINGAGALTVEVTKPAGESTLSRIITLVEEAQQDATPTQRLIDRFSEPYTLAVIGVTVLTFVVGWLLVSEATADSLYRAMTLLVVASPCALVISTPASILSAIAAGARGGVLFKGGVYLEKMATVDIIAFDKTGTLTPGRPVVTDVRPFNNYSEDDVLRLAASAELSSEHHIGRAIIEAARARDLPLETPTDFYAIAGHGIQAHFSRNGGPCSDVECEPDCETIFIGNEKLYHNEKMEFSPAISMFGDKLQAQGKTAMLVVRQSTVGDTLGSDRDWEVVGFIAVADAVRPEAAASVAALREAGIKRIAMLTGDNEVVAEAIGREVGIDEVYAGLLPEEKVDLIRKLGEEGKPAMVGDGVNDAPALASATVGVAMGAGGTDVALETADVVLMSSDLSRLPFTVTLGRRAARIVRQNVIFSVAVIVTLVILTLVVPFFVQGFQLPLPMGVVGHEGSTLIVVLNGMRLLAMKPKALIPA